LKFAVYTNEPFNTEVLVKQHLPSHILWKEFWRRQIPSCKTQYICNLTEFEQQKGELLLSLLHEGNV